MIGNIAIGIVVDDRVHFIYNLGYPFKESLVTQAIMSQTALFVGPMPTDYWFAAIPPGKYLQVLAKEFTFP